MGICVTQHVVLVCLCRVAQPIAVVRLRCGTQTVFDSWIHVRSILDLRGGSFADLWSHAPHHSAQHEMGLNNCDQMQHNARSCRIAV